MPAATPVTTPPDVTVAVLVDPLLHVPLGVPSDKVTVPPTHILSGPDGVIAAGLVLTVTVACTKQVPKV